MGSIGGASLNPLQNGSNTGQNSYYGTGSNTGTSSQTATNSYNPTITAASNAGALEAERGAFTPYSALSANQAVAGMSGNQQTAYNEAADNAGLINKNNGVLSQSWTNPGVQQQYMNPYESNVLNAQKAYAAQQYGQQTAALNTQEGMTGAFGGSGGAIEQAQNTQNYNLNLNSMEAQGLSSAYTQGEGQFNTAQQEALASNAQEYNALSSTGSVAQQVAQARDSYNVQQHNVQLNWQASHAQQLAQTLAQLPKNSTSTSKMDITGTSKSQGYGNDSSTSTNSGIANLGALASILGGGSSLLSGVTSALGGNTQSGVPGANTRTLMVTSPQMAELQPAPTQIPAMPQVAERRAQE